MNAGAVTLAHLVGAAGAAEQDLQNAARRLRERLAEIRRQADQAVGEKAGAS